MFWKATNFRHSKDFRKGACVCIPETSFPGSFPWERGLEGKLVSNKPADDSPILKWFWLLMIASFPVLIFSASCLRCKSLWHQEYYYTQTAKCLHPSVDKKNRFDASLRLHTYINTYIQTLFSSQKGFSENTKRKKKKTKWQQLKVR